MKISFDLDETLFVNPAEVPTEPELKFPYNKLYKDKLRKGAVQLLTEINKSDTELWIYTTSNRTERYINGIFKHYGIRIDSIVNAVRHCKRRCRPVIRSEYLFCKAPVNGTSDDQNRYSD